MAASVSWPRSTFYCAALPLAPHRKKQEVARLLRPCSLSLPLSSSLPFSFPALTRSAKRNNTQATLRTHPENLMLLTRGEDLSRFQNHFCRHNGHHKALFIHSQNPHRVITVVNDMIQVMIASRNIYMSAYTCNSIRHAWNFEFHKSCVPQPAWLAGACIVYFAFCSNLWQYMFYTKRGTDFIVIDFIV